MRLAKYNQAKTINFSLFEIDGVDMRINATFATGDITIMKNEGAPANTSNLPTDEGTGYSLVLTATEMSAARIQITMIDQTGTKVWLDNTIEIETFGNSSAEHEFDLDSTTVDVGAISGDSTAADNLELDYDGTGFSKTNSTVGTVTTVTNQLTAATIADANWDEAQSGHTTAGTFGKFLDVEVSSISAGSGLTSQETRDAMKLAPTGGAPAAGSIDDELDEILLDTAEIANLNNFDPATDTVVNVTNVTNQVTADVTALSGDSGAADNLEADYDGTGFTRANSTIGTVTDVTNLSSGGGGAINTAATTYVLTTGTQSIGTFGDVATVDAVHHEHTDDAGVLEIYYEYDVGINGVPSVATMDARINSANDSIDVFARNFVSSVWDQIGSLVGTGGSTNTSATFELLNSHVGSGVDDGIVRIRFFADSGLTSATLKVDRLTVGFVTLAAESLIFDQGIAQGGSNAAITLAATASSVDEIFDQAKVILVAGTGSGQERVIVAYNGTSKVASLSSNWVINPDSTTSYEILPARVHAATQAGGYLNNRVYLDSINGVAGTTNFFHGINTRPSNSLADARTIANNQNLRTFDSIPGSSFTLNQSFNDWQFNSLNTVFTLNSKAIDRSGWEQNVITGIAGRDTPGTGSFIQCVISVASLYQSTFVDTGILGVLTLLERAAYQFVTCFGFDEADGALKGIINVNGNNATKTTVIMMGFTGSIEIQNATAIDVIEISGSGRVVINANNNSGTTIRISGSMKITNNSSIVIDDTANYESTNIVSDGNPIDTTSGVIDRVTLVDITTVNSDLPAVDVKIDSILEDTNELQQDWKDGGRNDNNLDARATPAQVNSEMLDVLNVDIFAESSSAAPATTTIVNKLTALYDLAMNEINQTATTQTLRNRADTITISSSTVSDDGTTFTRGSHT